MFKIEFRVDKAKKQRTLRICGNFRITIHALLDIKQYFVPKIENIFANLDGGQRFSKINLTDYSKVHLTINIQTNGYIVVTGMF